MQLDKDLMIRAYSNLSHFPEERGERDFAEFSKQLEEDLAELGGKSGNYREKFIQRLHLYYHRKSRCTSAFIVGPANYNVRRHNKTHSSADRAWEDFVKWRSRYFKKAFAIRTLSPEEELDKTISDLDKDLNFHAKMLETNKLLRKYKIDRDITCGFEKDDREKAFISEMMEVFDNDIAQIDSTIKADCYGIRGFASFSLTNSNARIKNKKQKIEIMKARIARKESFKPIEFKGGQVLIENDRVVIKHDEKPSREIIDAIKKRGFKWSPKMGNWCRKHTGNALNDAHYLVSFVFNKE